MKYTRGDNLVLCLLVFVSVYMFGSAVSAKEDGALKINELCADPKIGETEWIEIYNSSLINIDLSDFTIEDGTNRPNRLSGIIDADSYLVLEKGTDFSFGLNNSGDTIILKNAEEIIDQITYGSFDAGWGIDNNAMSPNKERTISRIPNGIDSNIDKNDFCETQTTQGSKNMRPTYSKMIAINEVVPHPDKGANNEFIEIINLDTTEVRLDFWQLDDILGGSAPYSLPEGTKILPGESMVFYKTQTGIALNDSGDSVRLIDPNGDIVSSITFDQALKGQSFSYFVEGWFWSLALTPKQKNVLSSPKAVATKEEISVISIKKARDHNKGEKVKIRGCVTSLPGDISESYFYVEDETAGVQIYNYHKDFPVLEYGDIIEIFGEISQVSTEARVKSENIAILESSDKVAPQTREVKDINEETEGRLVFLSGEVISPSGSTFYIQQEEQKIKIVVKNKNVNKPRLKSGYLVQVKGVVSEYRGEYRILLYEPNSVKILQSNELPRAGKDTKKMIIIYIGIWILFHQAKRKQKRLLQVLLRT